MANVADALRFISPFAKRDILHERWCAEQVEIADHIGSSSDTPENTPQGQ